MTHKTNHKRYTVTVDTKTRMIIKTCNICGRVQRAVYPNQPRLALNLKGASRDHIKTEFD